MVQNKETPMETDDSKNEVFQRESADYQDRSFSHWLGIFRIYFLGPKFHWVRK